MKIYKFRGKREDNGNFVYGGIFQSGKQFMIIRVDFDAEGYAHPDFIDVDPDTVAQFVGYDADGKEVYEGDKLVDSFEHVWLANVYRSAENNDDWTYYTDLKNLKLKKE